MLAIHVFYLITQSSKAIDTPSFGSWHILTAWHTLTAWHIVTLRFVIATFF